MGLITTILIIILIFVSGFATIQIIEETNEIKELQITIKQNPCFLNNKFNSTIPGIVIPTPGPTPS